MMKESDRIKFYKNLGTYEALIRHEMDDVGYMSETKNITLEAITNIEKIAQKYNLYGNEWKTDSCYLHKYVIPRLKKFFESPEYAFEEALNELWWYSDQENPMNDFCKFIEEFANDMKGYTKAKVINLSDFDFKRGDVYVAYEGPDDNRAIVLKGDDFIIHIINTMDTLDNEYKELWAEEISKIIKKYE